jgi:sugar lactone lactonase YvrE
MRTKHPISWAILVLSFIFILVSCGGNDESTGLVVTTLAGSAKSMGSEDGTGSAARFAGPEGITSDDTHLYVVDTFNHTIRQIAIATGEVTTFAGTPDVIGSTDDIGAAALFCYPRGIATDGTNLYVTDQGNATIRKIVISTKEVTTLAGTVGVFGSIDGTSAVARFRSPTGITTDGNNLYVTDSGSSTIREIVISNGEVTTLAGSAIHVGGYDDGIGSAARFWIPTGITTDGTNLYVLDGDLNNTIRKIVVSTGEVTTLAGTAGVVGSSDGVGPLASFNSADGIITDGTSLYIADSGNSSIRKVAISTAEVTTIAGSVDRTGSADGDVTVASFLSPKGIALNDTKLFVVDSGASTIRKME